MSSQHMHETEAHISSLVVQARPDNVAALALSIGEMQHVEVPISSPEGKLVVCMETASLGEVTDSIEAISAMPGVLSCALVSHHVEAASALDELVEIDPNEQSETMQ